jgi:hypothetical protein
MGSRPRRTPDEKWHVVLERQRLVDSLRQMMAKKVHEAPEAHAEMLKHCDGKLPAVFDPFSGGGSTMTRRTLILPCNVTNWLRMPTRPAG